MERHKAVNSAMRDLLFLMPSLPNSVQEAIRIRLEWMWQIGYEDANTRRPINKKRIAMYNRHGLLLNTFDSVAKAAKELDLNRPTLSMAARTGRLTRNGHYWKYVDENGNQLKE